MTPAITTRQQRAAYELAVRMMSIALAVETCDWLLAKVRASAAAEVRNINAQTPTAIIAPVEADQSNASPGVLGGAAFDQGTAVVFAKFHVLASQLIGWAVIVAHKIRGMHTAQVRYGAGPT